MVDVSGRVNIERVSPQNEFAFFGYYDISPESPDGTKILCNISQFSDRMPQIGDELSVGFIDENKKFNKIGCTTAWNFQEGCRLQWIDDDKVIYNFIDDERIRSLVYSIEKNDEIMHYSMPIYSVNRKNGYALSYNLYRSRYNYPHTREMEETDYEEDGVFIINLKTGKTKLIISLNVLVESTPVNATKTWVEHAVFNPAGDKFFFFHRGALESGGYFTRFCLSDLEGNIKVLLDSGMCSHSGWIDNDRITSWARIPNKMNAFPKNGFLQKIGFWNIAVGVYHAVVKKPEMMQKFTNEAYVVFDTISMNSYKIENKEFVRDGHETWSQDSRYMLTDTYPDEKNFRKLMLYDYKEDIIYSIGDFYSYPEIGTKEYKDNPGIRCDLHPKWSYQEKYIYFDSTHEGYRGLYRADISGLKE